jgi:hypothetical protein
MYIVFLVVSKRARHWSIFLARFGQTTLSFILYGLRSVSKCDLTASDIMKEKLFWLISLLYFSNLALGDIHFLKFARMPQALSTRLLQ